MQKMIESKKNKQKILKEFLKIAQKTTISDEILQKSLKNCQIEEKYQKIIFENGVLSLLEFYIEEIIEKMQQEITKQVDFNNFKIRDKVRFALYNIFEQQNPKIAAKIQEFYLNPANLCQKQGAKPAILAFKNAIKLSDAIWGSIGDSSTDFNYYSKRLILAKIIITTFQYFTKEKDQKITKTKQIIDQEIAKIMKFEKFKAKTKENFRNFFLDENNQKRKIKDIIKDLPFIRLFN